MTRLWLKAPKNLWRGEFYCTDEAGVQWSTNFIKGRIKAVTPYPVITPPLFFGMVLGIAPMVAALNDLLDPRSTEFEFWVNQNPRIELQWR